MTERTVTLYVGNRIDAAIDVDPGELVAEFVSWDESDFDALIDALRDHFAAAPAVRDEMWKRIDPLEDQG